MIQKTHASVSFITCTVLVLDVFELSSDQLIKPLMKLQIIRSKADNFLIYFRMSEYPIVLYFLVFSMKKDIFFLKNRIRKGISGMKVSLRLNQSKMTFKL